MTTPGSTPNSRTWQILAHLSALVWIVGIPGVVGPLVVWLLYRQDPDIEEHAREALNFHVSMLIYGFGLGIAALVLLISVVGIILLPVAAIAAIALLIWSVVATIIGGSRASNGELYRYPFNLGLIK